MAATARGLATSMRQRRAQLERLDTRLQRAVALELKRFLRRRRLTKGAHVGLGAERPELQALAYIDVSPENPLCFISLPEYAENRREADLPVVAHAPHTRLERDAVMLQKLVGRMGMAWQVVPQDDGEGACTISVMAGGPSQTRVHGHYSPNQGEALACQQCGGELVALGQLGSRIHFRCRDCGIDQSLSASELPE